MSQNLLALTITESSTIFPSQPRMPVQILLSPTPMASDFFSSIQVILHKAAAVAQVPFGSHNRLASILSLHHSLNYAICDEDLIENAMILMND